MSESTIPHGVVLAGTPLGNIADASERLRYLLAHADVIAAEDTRRTRALIDALGVSARGTLISNFDHNEESRVAKLLDAARTGTVVVVTDAGMPVVSDPGLALVAAAHDAGIPVSCVPGPSAVTTALALSGLNVGTFIFDGFAPRKDGARRTWLESLRREKRAVCFFESPHRIASTLALAEEILSSMRRVAVCRELTKTYEEVRRGTLHEVVAWAQDGVRGEVTVVLEGAGDDDLIDLEELIPAVEEQVTSGARLKAACKAVGASASVSARELYEAVLKARSQGDT